MVMMMVIIGDGYGGNVDDGGDGDIRDGDGGYGIDGNATGVGAVEKVIGMMGRVDEGLGSNVCGKLSWEREEQGRTHWYWGGAVAQVHHREVGSFWGVFTGGFLSRGHCLGHGVLG